MSSASVQEAVAREQRAELAHLVPEDRVVPVLDVEVVALDVREHRPREAEVLVERAPASSSGAASRYSAVMRSRSARHRVERPVDVLAGLQALDVVRGCRERDGGIVDPGAVVVVEAVAVRVVEPRRLGRLPVGRATAAPASLAASGDCAARPRPRPPRRRRRSPSSIGALGEALELLVGPEEDDVDAGDHLRDRLVGDVGEALLAELVEDEVGGVAEVEELEVVLPDPVDALEQAVVRDEQRVARADARAPSVTTASSSTSGRSGTSSASSSRIVSSTFCCQRP